MTLPFANHSVRPSWAGSDDGVAEGGEEDEGGEEEEEEGIEGVEEEGVEEEEAEREEAWRFSMTNSPISTSCSGRKPAWMISPASARQAVRLSTTTPGAGVLVEVMVVVMRRRSGLT